VPTAASLKLIRKRLHERAEPSRVAILQSFFKTGPGQYAEGDVFIGVTVPSLRQVCRECGSASLDDIESLLRSTVHEERLLALLLLVDAFRRGSTTEQRRIYRLYLSNTRFINNWDLVDSSAPQIVGASLFERSRAPLTRLARSRSLWERRIAIVATHYFIGQGDLEDTFRIADLLLTDSHDLIHKAVGWMLREAGKRDARAERAYLKTRYERMPRTMLRYAIERFPERERKKYLLRTIVAEHR
jgi:3-methyladenine DNA glycosylase AlkD